MITEIISENYIKRKTILTAEKLSKLDINNTVFVCVLRGSFKFFNLLIESLDLFGYYPDIDFITVSSYENTESTGKITIKMDIAQSVEGKHVVLVEDIVDTGLTITELIKIMKDKGASEVTTVTMLNKPSRRKVNFEPDYSCFNISDLFIVGYGLDYNQKYRTLPYIGVFSED